MTDDSTSDATAEPTDAGGLRAGLLDDATTVARGLRVAANLLAIPGMSVAAGAFCGFLIHAAISLYLLSREVTAAWLVWLGLALTAIAVVGIFLFRLVATVRAAKDPDALAADLLGMVDVSAITTAALADLAEVTSREGGVRVVSRARALWRLMRRLDPSEHTSSFARGRWFVPPGASLTWLYAQLMTWSGLAAWVLGIIAIALLLAGAL